MHHPLHRMEPQKTSQPLQVEDTPHQTNQPRCQHRARIPHKDQEEKHGHLQRRPLRTKDKEENTKGVERFKRREQWRVEVDGRFLQG